MEMLLIGVTLVSLALATSLAAVAWKVLRDHHRFAAARVDALAALAAGGEPHEAGALGAPFESRELMTPALEESAQASFELPLATETTAAPMFAAAPAQGVGRRRSLALVMAGLVMAAGAAATYAVHVSGATFLSTVLRAASRAETPAGAPPLELRALQYTIDETRTFVVSGIVVDPAGGRSFEGVAAVIYLFDADGTCFANGRAAIDVTPLRAGGESSFEVRVHATTPVSRYRVGFRLADGATVAHVDKRQVNR
jgi:hypothetical protein